ncbi:MAG: glycosyltransferase family 2 protein, partial [Eubacterium sp.]|nr:glycosyltransferase family 2 protein [Eubacterium sp.]
MMSYKDLLADGASEMCFELGRYFYDMGEFAEAGLWFYNAIHETEPILNVKSHDEWPREWYAKCAKELEQG